MDIDKSALSKHYHSLSDDQIISLIKYEVKDLTTEAIPILIDEIKRRKFPSNFVKQLELQYNDSLQAGKTFSLEEINELQSIINVLQCPVCGKNENSINASKIYRVKSFIVLTYSESYILFGCSDCIRKDAKNALISSLLLGWWGVWGLIKTPKAIYINLNALKKSPSDMFVKILTDNASYIKANKYDKNRLKEILSSYKFINPNRSDI